jgi:hypothetical protein
MAKDKTFKAAWKKPLIWSFLLEGNTSPFPGQPTCQSK